MDSYLTPNSASTTGTKRSKIFLPLSHHGMPKTPLPTSPGGSVRSHRFSMLRSPPMSPGTPTSPAMSPPLSAKSFGTFIDSEPSTPAYSPRAPSSNWDGSTLVLLSPVRSPSIPQEPEWEMMAPQRQKEKNPKAIVSAPKLGSKITPASSLSSHPIAGETEKEQKENVPPESGENKEEAQADPEHEEEHPVPPRGKLVNRMKSMLRRKTISEKKVENKRRLKEDLDRMEDVHWTEM